MRSPCVCLSQVPPSRHGRPATVSKHPSADCGTIPHYAPEEQNRRLCGPGRRTGRLGLRIGRAQAIPPRLRPTPTRRSAAPCGASPTATRPATPSSLPSVRQIPDLDLKTATFDSVQEGSAKIAGGFETDIVQACTDEYQPLLARNLLRPIDPDGVTAWEDLDFRDNEGIQTIRRTHQLRADRGGAAGDHLQHRRRSTHRHTRGPISSTRSTPGGARSTAEHGSPRWPRRRSRWASRTRCR